jgi:hypothetical protein
MEAIISNPALSKAMKNELDFLVYLGMPVGDILRYIRHTGASDEDGLAKILGVPTRVERKLEKVRGQLPPSWHSSLRVIFEN